MKGKLILGDYFNSQVTVAHSTLNYCNSDYDNIKNRRKLNENYSSFEKCTTNTPRQKKTLFIAIHKTIER